MSVELTGNIVLKYCGILDEFIKVRIFSDRDIHDLFESSRVNNKRSYQQLVLNTCMVNYNDEILPRLQLMAHHLEGVDFEEELYRLCVEVNPSLEISKVTLPVTEAEKSQIHLLEKPEHKELGFTLKQVLALEKELSQQIIGQAHAIETVTKAIKRAFVGIQRPNRPIGTFFFVGQTGVGKTALAKVLATALYQDPSYLIRIDCSEYSLPHEYAKLIGAPPGYIGYQEGGYLTNTMRTKGRGVVLFDEVEKADLKVHNLLLQLLDEGFITDNMGNAVHFDTALIIFTSNLGVDEVQAHKNKIGFDWAKRQTLTHETLYTEILEAFKKAFKPEFLNRVDEVVLFDPLTLADCAKIIDLFLNELKEATNKAGIHVEFTKKVRDFLAHKGYNPDYGARELRRTVEDLVEVPLTDAILKGSIRPRTSTKVSVAGDKLLFQTSKSHQASSPNY